MTLRGAASWTEKRRREWASLQKLRDKGGVVMKIKPLPMGVDILNPVALPQLAKPVVEAEDVLSALQREFGIPATALDPANPLTLLNRISAVGRVLESPLQ